MIGRREVAAIEIYRGPTLVRYALFQFFFKNAVEFVYPLEIIAVALIGLTRIAEKDVPIEARNIGHGGPIAELAGRRQDYIANGDCLQ
jgi:hypothetical protein